VRILVLINYSSERVQKEIESGLKPAHHLYGVDYLRKERYDIVVVPYDESKRRSRRKLAEIIYYFFGDVQHQYTCLKLLKKDDIIYAPCQTQTSLLAYLRFFKIINNKIISIAHHMPVKGRLAKIKKIFFKIEVKGVFSFPSLSNKVANYINALASQPKSPIFTWGPDIAYYDKFILKENPDDIGFFCSGRTGRDYTTMLKGAELADKELSLYYLSNDGFSSANSKIKLHKLAKEQDFLYDKSLKIMARSRAICVPLYEEKLSLVGLTSLTDAIGMGKPVIMTRHEFIDIDIEKEGIGIWVDAGKPEAWKDAFNLLSDDKVYKEMSANSLRIRNEYFNYGIFCFQLMKCLSSAIV